MADVFIYLDESGDLGFGNGASKFFVISFISMNGNTSKKLKRAIIEVKRKHRIPSNVELKAFNSSHQLRIDVLEKICALPLGIYSITINKQKVDKPLRNDTNILYNYVTNLIMVPYLTEGKFKKVNIIVDLRISKVARGRRFDDYLKYKLIFEGKVYGTNLDIKHLDSLYSKGLQAIDFIANSFFRKYEREDERYYQIIQGRIKENREFFF